MLLSHAPCGANGKRNKQMVLPWSNYRFCHLSPSNRKGRFPILTLFVATLKKEPPGKNSVRFAKATVDGFRGFESMEINVATMFSRDDF